MAWGWLYILLVSGKPSDLFVGLEETFKSFKCCLVYGLF